MQIFSGAPVPPTVETVFTKSCGKPIGPFYRTITTHLTQADSVTNVLGAYLERKSTATPRNSPIQFGFSKMINEPEDISQTDLVLPLLQIVTNH